MAENLSADRSKMLGCLQNEGKFRNTNSNIEVLFFITKMSLFNM